MLLLVLLLLLVVVVVLLLTTMAFSSIVPCYILDTTTPGLTEEDTAAGATPTSSRLAGRGTRTAGGAIGCLETNVSQSHSETNEQQAPAVLMSPASSLPVLLFVSPVLCCSFLVVLVAAVLVTCSLPPPV